MDAIRKFTNNYISLLSGLMTNRDLGTTHEIGLPFFDHLGDALTVYIEKTDPIHYKIDDDGYIIDNLEMSGLNLTDKRKETLLEICNNFGIQVVDNKLQATATKSNLPQMVHNLAQVMLRIDDMYMTSTERVKSYFAEDIRMFFDENNIYYTPNPSFLGKSGLNQSFDFSFQKNKDHGFRLCIAVNNGSKENAEKALFKWTDILGRRDDHPELYIIVNNENKINKDFDDILHNYGARVYTYSDLASHLNDFS